MQKDENQTKYSMLKAFLKDEILMGNIKPGEKIPSENTLAEKFSLSRQTVRKAISMLVNEGFLYTRQGKGTFCRDRTASRRDSRNIGVITTYISEYIFPRLIQGIDKVLSENGYSIILKNTGNSVEKEAACLDDLLGNDVGGLIIEPTRSALFSGNLKYYRALDRHRIPYVFIHGYYQLLEDKPRVVLDDEAGEYSAVEHLIKLGHRNILGIFKADDIQGINRHKGYARALADNGIMYDPDKVVWFHTEDRFTKPCIAVRDIISSGTRIDAIAAYNDMVAVKVLEQLGKLGLSVPDDISVVGFDDSYLAQNNPVKLTTVGHPKEKLGEAAAELLLELMSGQVMSDSAAKEKVIVPELTVRDSCVSRPG
ncbi:MAG: GntR family transcriptional regulator [Acetivibrionales bacterium]|jgi:GntR family transcriptional regulator of arabinose operon|nr:GntR family transcriptional regulator [Bacillota bacterium]HOA54201.1 GntR family transcriptional regulator [Clostridiales bacterium]HQD31056.1 GntR family transcriptional regulator [Clostridiales bacterium]